MKRFFFFICIMVHTFCTAGTYKVAADNADDCGAASGATVPPLPLSAISGVKTACIESAITLSATPTSPLYGILWEPVCADYKRSGEKVTIVYDNVVCDVNVYQFDKITGCLSAPTTYSVAPFVIAPFGYTSPIVVCAGQTLPFSVPYQEEVLYSWTIAPIEAASVQNNDKTNSVQVVINRLAAFTPPYQVAVQLKREYCGQEMFSNVILAVNDIGTPTVTCNPKTLKRDPLPVITDVSVKSPYCVRTPLLLQVTGTNISKILWDFGDGASFFGNNTSVYHTYQQSAGEYTLKVTAYNNNGCSTIYTKEVKINTFNMQGHISTNDNKVCAGQPQTVEWNNPNPSFTYQWSMPLANSDYKHFVYESGDYDVTVKSKIGCVCKEKINISFYHNPTAKIAGKTEYYFGEPVALYGNTGEDDVTYKWAVTNPQSHTDFFYTPNIEFKPDFAGIYNVKLTVSNAHCDSTTEVEIEVKDGFLFK